MYLVDWVFCFLSQYFVYFVSKFGELLKIERTRRNRSQMFFKIDVLKIFAIFTRKHLCCSLFLIKLQAFGTGTLLKRDSNKGVNIAKFLRTAFLIVHLRWLFLNKALRISVMAGHTLDNIYKIVTSKHSSITATHTPAERSHSQEFYRTGLLKNVAKFTRKHLQLIRIFSNVADPVLQVTKNRIPLQKMFLELFKFLKIVFYRAYPDDCFCN